MKCLDVAPQPRTSARKLLVLQWAAAKLPSASGNSWPVQAIHCDNPVSSRVNALQQWYRVSFLGLARQLMAGISFQQGQPTTWNNLEPSWTILNLQHPQPSSHILRPQCGAGCQWCSTSQNTQPAWAGCVASVERHGGKHPIPIS